MKGMRHKTILVLLCAAALPAAARWELVGEGEAIYIFADRDTLRRDGTLAQMQHLLDYKEHQPEGVKPYQSWRVDAEYDCAAFRYRELTATFHPHRLGEGSAVSTMRYPGNWQAIPPATGLDRLARIACDRPEEDRKKSTKLAPPISPLRRY